MLRGGREIGTLAPEKRFYKKPQQPTTEVAIRSTLAEDLYLVLGALRPADRARDVPGLREPARRRGCGSAAR